MYSLLRPVLAAAALSAAVFSATQSHAEGEAERAVLYYFDGLHPDAIDRLDLPVLKELRTQCASVREAVMLFPWHPTTGSYGLMHTTSLPNPVTMTGNLFLRPGQRMLQHQFPRKINTAIAVGSKAYDTLTPGFDLVYLLDTADATLTDMMLDLLDRHDPKFFRIQLQDVGRAGYRTINAPDDAPHQADIWHAESPYAEVAREADRQLGRFIDKMKSLERWQDTFFVFMADGQSRHGWHGPMDEESWRTPMIVCGPGVRKGHTIPYAEIIDVVPTMARAVGADAPNPGPGSGRILEELFSDGGDAQRVPKRILRLNNQIKEHLLLSAELRLLSQRDPRVDNVLMLERNALTRGDPAPFLGIEQIDRWHEAGTIDALLKRNEDALTYLRSQRDRFKSADGGPVSGG